MQPLTLGTAGHIDHGKTALVRALTGVDTDRLPEERSRGMTIELGYAPLRLDSGRRLSVVDVPGHERLVRTMVAGATGIDLFLLAVAADDGVMPQTREHVAVLRALGVSVGVVAVTKSDVADPGPAQAEVRDLLGPGVAVVPASSVTGEGVAALRAALDAAAASIAARPAGGEARLHVDRVFTIAGAGTVVTGTLWSGSVAVGDSVAVLPRPATARVRGLQVHDAPVSRAAAGQRVAINLAGVRRESLRRGDVIVPVGGSVVPRYRLDARLSVDGELPARVMVHHGTREARARAVALESGLWQLRVESPLMAEVGDRVVVRSIAPPDTLGGGIVVGFPSREPPAAAPAAGAVSVVHEREAPVPPDELARAREVLLALMERDGSVTIASYRDGLGASRRVAQALLEHFDHEKLTLRRGDERILRRRRAT